MKLKNKKILVLGLANKRSIAWGVLRKLRLEGASLGVCYFSSSNLKRVEPLANEINADFICEVDVTKQKSIENLSVLINKKWGEFDGLVHSIAYCPDDEFGRRFHTCSREGFLKTLDISAVSLVSLIQQLRPSFGDNFSVTAMTYYGSQKVLPGYNIMGVAKATLEAIIKYLAQDLGRDGIRVNCISAGPIKTLAAFNIPNFNDFLEEIKEHSPLQQNISIDDVGNLSSFLMSDESKAITGQVLYVDSGMSIIAR